MHSHRLLVCHSVSNVFPGAGKTFSYLSPVLGTLRIRNDKKRLVLCSCCLVFGIIALWGQTCTITHTHTDVLCYGEVTGSINISVTGGTEPYIFSWTGPGSFTSTSQNLSNLEAGSYTLSVNGSSGSCTGSATIVIGQPSQPLMITSQPLDQTDCYGNTVEFSVEVSGAVGTLSYQWQSRSPGGNFSYISGSNASTLTIHDIGVNRQNIDGTEYQVVITDDCETITSETALLSINSITDLTGRVNLTICYGESTTYEVSAHGQITGYQWSFNDGTGWDPISNGGAWSGATSSQLSISNATTAESGSYRVSVTFNTLNQPPDYPTCVITSHSRTRNLTVLPALSPPVVSADQSVCYNGVPDPLLATPASGGSGPDYYYQWQSSTEGNSWNNIGGAHGLSYSPPVLTTSTFYRVAATDEGSLSCGTTYSLPVIITVGASPRAAISANGPTTFCDGGSVVLTSSVASSYLWSTGETTRSITVRTSGSYSVTITDACGNTSTSTQEITVTHRITPTFTRIGPLALNSTPPQLPRTSNNGITGSWNPARINTSNIGTSTYTFNPAADQCANITTMEITVVNTGLTITKSAAEAGYSSTGDVIHYTIAVTNAGNVALSNITVSDPQTGLNDVIADLAPGSSRILTTTYTIVQEDINRGYFENTSRAIYSYSGTSYSESASLTLSSVNNPDITVLKTSNESGFSREGDLLHYTITVINSGNVTLTGVVVTDPDVVLSCNRTPATLAPGERIACTAVHEITADDMENGRVANRASAIGFGPDMQNISGFSNEVILPLRNSAPTVRCPQHIITNAGSNTCEVLVNSGLSAFYSDPDNDIISLTWEMTGATVASSSSTGLNNLSGFTFNTGVTNIIYTVSDGAGQNATCSFTITVTDTIRPVITCPGNQERSTDRDNPTYTVTGTEFDSVSVWDNCSVSGLTNDFNGLSTLDGAHFPVGVTTIVWTITDISGMSASCSYNVTVADHTNPEARCRNIDVYLDLDTGTSFITPSDVDDGSYDNTAIDTMTISQTAFDCTDIGPNVLTLTVTDIYGNAGICTSTVTVHYALNPDPVVTPSADVLCDNEPINLILSNNIPGTRWTWTVNPANGISGASADNTGNNSVISQTLHNSDISAHNVVYNIIPHVYDICHLSPITAELWVNPEPEIQISANDTIICNGEVASISVNNPNGQVRGQWMYDLTIIADPGITGNRSGGLFTTSVQIIDSLTNNDTIIRKVTYAFTPGIVPDDAGPVCIGSTRIINIWVYPRLDYTRILSDYNGFNISCYGKSNGFINIDPSSEFSPFEFNWSGPDGFAANDEDISGLVAGSYRMSITDKNGCISTETFNLNEPGKLGTTINTSVSIDGAYNINCAGEKTGFINLSAFNNVGSVDYLWIDGYIGSSRINLSAGNYKILLMDSNNCFADSTVTLAEPDEIHIDFIITEPFCPEKSDGEIKLEVTGGVQSHGYTYRWYDNSAQSSISNIPAGYYNVRVTDDNGCSVKDSVRLRAKNKICLVIPDAFSPNNDLINDVWNIENIDLYPGAEITIYNRWGQMIWQSDPGYPAPWDGRSRGERLPVDSYHYFIDLHNGSKPIIGNVTVVR